ncbi:oxalate/formate antiporter [Tieghemostelium lacteum]|uniref:Oxalate/formate antiporter n=1 Tax=Tieghemostelium lacteum TaxID=361077 RepID=A0A152A184_TIELA|nr:oxalate/formate antiporter [Tieghemostelium lacteum]|eukprot:KYQ99985.1 oxalate/formate antiporter [Tieghemostelium lacteum]
MENRKKKNFLTKFLEYHYSDFRYYNDDNDSLDNTYFIFKFIPFDRWILFGSALIVQFCVGSFYAWSIYNKPIDKAIFGDENKNMANISFFITIGMFGFSAALMGPWVERQGPKRGIGLGGVLFAIGHYLTAIGIHVKAIWLVYVGYGVIGGFGLGICYISPVSSLNKWFPDKKGVASGFAVCGFGAGSIAFAKFPLNIIHDVGIIWNFAILGSIQLIILLSQASIFRNPPSNFNPFKKPIKPIVEDIENTNPVLQQTPSQIEIQPPSSIPPPPIVQNQNIPILTENPFPPNSDKIRNAGFTIGEDFDEIEDARQILPIQIINSGKITPEIVTNLRDPNIRLNIVESLFSLEFKLMYVVFLANTIFGLIVISRLSNIVQDIFGKDKIVASMVVSVNGGFNLAGRLLYAFLSDKIGRKYCYLITLTIQVMIVSAMTFVLESKSFVVFVILIWLNSSCYGASFGIIPAFLHDQFGPKNISPTHGVILTSWSLAGVGGGLLFTQIYDHVISQGYSVHDAFAYNVNLYWILAIIIVGWFTIWFVRTKPREKLLPDVPGQIFRFRLFGRMIRCTKSEGIVVMTKEQEDLEWKNYLVDYYQNMLTVCNNNYIFINNNNSIHKNNIDINSKPNSISNSSSTNSTSDFDEGGATLPVEISN